MGINSNENHGIDINRGTNVKKKKKKPKLRIPIAPPGKNWSKKDYNRKEGKKVPSPLNYN